MKTLCAILPLLFLFTIEASTIAKRQSDRGNKLDCNSLVNCLKNVTKIKPKCGCSDIEKKIMQDYNQCLTDKNIEERCPSSSNLCISVNELECYFDQDKCFKQFYGSFTTKEKNDMVKADEECEAMITSKYPSSSQ